MMVHLVAHRCSLSQPPCPSCCHWRSEAELDTLLSISSFKDLQIWLGYEIRTTTGVHNPLIINPLMPFMLIVATLPHNVGLLLHDRDLILKLIHEDISTCARCRKWWTGGRGPCPRTIFFVRGPLSGVRLVRGCAFPSSGPWPCSKNAWMRSKCRGFTSSWQTASDIAQLQTPRVRKKLDELPIFKKTIST